MDLVSAKRKRNERSGVHGWHPYYAGYSESFVASAIAALDLNENTLLLDPWNGSGTSGLVAAKFGINSIGLDINPVMNIFSTAKTPAVLKMESALIKEFKVILKRARNLNVSTANDPLEEWTDVETANRFRSIALSILKNAVLELPLSTLHLRALKAECSPIKISQAFFFAALFIEFRQSLGVSSGSNPTWTKATEQKLTIHLPELEERLIDRVKVMIKDLKSVYNGSSSDAVFCKALEASSKAIPVKDNSVDGIITSPPYLTRIDYAMSTRPEILLLTSTNRLREVREATMGAPVIVDKNIEVKPAWGERAVRLLDGVCNHSAKASKSYYYPNMLQYFRDAELSLKEIARVLKPNKSALIVVQSSYYKEIEIPLGDIFAEMAESLDLQASIPFREEVKGHMAHVNTKSSAYKENKVYFEDAVLVTKTGH